MTVSKQKNGKFLCQIYRKGFKRIRKLFDDEKTALIYDRTQLETMRVQRDLISDERTLKELVKLWFKYHGINLSDGVRQRDCLLAISEAFGNPKACLLTAEQFVDYRFNRLNDGLTAKTFNNQHGYLSAMFNKLKKLKVIQFDNPISDIDRINIQERQLSYLSVHQINELMSDIKNKCHNKSTWYVVQICVRTGARWGEAEQLCLKQIKPDRITFEITKSKKTRTVAIDKNFIKKLLAFAKGKSPRDRVFTNCIGAFRRSVKRSGIDLPRGQCTHILRHSFASHFIMNKGDILTLKTILGHADIHTTLRYAHLSPDHMKDAVLFNPLS